MKLHIGEQAPDFSIVDILGNTIALQNYKNKKLLLCFFRYAGCPFCGVAFLDLFKKYPLLASKGLEIVAFFQSTPQYIHKYIVDKYHPTFPIIPDIEKKVYDLYKIDSDVLGWPRSIPTIPRAIDGIVHDKLVQGVIDGDPNLMPGSFLIGPPEFTIFQAHYGKTFMDPFFLSEITDFLAAQDNWDFCS